MMAMVDTIRVALADQAIESPTEQATEQVAEQVERLLMAGSGRG